MPGVADTRLHQSGYLEFQTLAKFHLKTLLLCPVSSCIYAHFSGHESVDPKTETLRLSLVTLFERMGLGVGVISLGKP